MKLLAAQSFEVKLIHIKFVDIVEEHCFVGADKNIFYKSILGPSPRN